jgi:hypothetical protein
MSHNAWHAALLGQPCVQLNADTKDERSRYKQQQLDGR